MCAYQICSSVYQKWHVETTNFLKVRTSVIWNLTDRWKSINLILHPLVNRGNQVDSGIHTIFRILVKSQDTIIFLSRSCFFTINLFSKFFQRKLIFAKQCFCLIYLFCTLHSFFLACCYVFVELTHNWVPIQYKKRCLQGCSPDVTSSNPWRDGLHFK